MRIYDNMVVIFAYPIFILSDFCQFMSFYEPFGFSFAYIYFFLLTSEDDSLVSHHPKHQLNICVSIQFFQGLSSHIFSVYVSLSVSFQTFLVSPNIFCVTVSL